MSSPARIRLAHVASSDLAIPALMPFCGPLLARGWEVTMITPDGPHVAAGRTAGLRWLPLSLERKLAMRTDIEGTLELARYFRQEAFDIVHTHNIKAGHIGRVVAAATRVPIVVHTIHGMAYSLDTPPLKRRLHALLERIANVGCDMVLTQSREDRDTCLATRVVAPHRIDVIGNGIDLGRFVPSAGGHVRDAARASLGLDDDEILFVSAGRLIREKGYFELFDAARRARARDRRIRLAVAGPLDARSDTLSERDLDAARRDGILLLGARADMPVIYEAADVVVLASWHEGMPRVLMEGAAMGKPLLATDVCGCREIVEHEVNGLLVPVRDASALTAAMWRLATDPALRSSFGARNQVIAPARFSIDAAVARVTATYDRLLGAD